MNEEVISFISQSANTLVLNAILFLFFKNMYLTKYVNKTIYIGSFLLASLVMFLINQLENPVVNIIYALVSFNFICNILYKTKLKQSFLYNSIFILILFAFEIVTVLIWTIMKNEEYSTVLKDYELMCISNLLNILVMFLVYKVCVAVFSKNEQRSIRIKEAVTIVIITVFEIYVIYNLSCLPTSGSVFIVIMFGFLALNIYITYVIEQISQNIKLKFDLELSERQSRMQLLHYTELDDKYNKSRKLVHDIKKHLAVLHELRSTDFTESAEYGKMIEDEVESLFCGFQCSNKILGIVLSQKISRAESIGITVITAVEDVPLDFMNNFDITAIFANIWDNAIEACDNANSQNNFIEFIMKKVNGFIIINISNSYNGEVKNDNGIFLSNKKDHAGIGLSIINSSVEKYNGLFAVKYEDLTFNVEVTIPIPIINKK